MPFFPLLVAMTTSLFRPLNLAWIGRYWLTILLAIAFVLSTLLSIEQNRVITAQQTLIQTLYFDSASLISLKIKLAREQQRRGLNSDPQMKKGANAPFLH